MKTVAVKAKDIKKEWLVVDAEGQTLGRLATEISRVLRGKHKPIFVPHLDCGDNIIVVNASKIKLTGNKLTDKMYYHHTGYIGGIKAASASEILAKRPERLIHKAVKGMLPKNKLSNHLMTNLRVYPNAEHPHEGQNPKPFTPRIQK